MLTDREIVNLFEQHHPATPEAAQALGLSLAYISNGGSRRVYQIGKGLAVKFCIYPANIEQSQNEIACIELMNADPALEKFRPHIPVLFYGNRETGVIVTKYYPGKVTQQDEDKFRNLMNSLRSVGVNDLFCDNFRQDTDGTFVAVDLGYYRRPE